MCSLLGNAGLLLQVGDPSLGAVPSDVRRGAGATGCPLRGAGPRPPHPPASLQVLAAAQAPPRPGLQSGALPCQVGPFPRRRVVLGVAFQEAPDPPCPRLWEQVTLVSGKAVGVGDA